MQSLFRLRHVALPALLLSIVCTAFAQDHDHDRDRDRDHVPPGQAKKYDDGDRHMPPGQARKYDGDQRHMPPGQAKRYFHDEDRDRFYSYYRHDADRWRGRRRPVVVVGQYIAPQVVIRPVPRTYWVNVAPPPPPGYRYGYCGGYVVAYNPATRIVADVLDLVDAANSR